MLTLPWRKKDQSFQWIKHEKTQIRLRREARQERLSAIGYLARIFTSLLGLKLRAFFELLLLKATRARTRTSSWVRTKLPVHLSGFSAAIVATFTGLRRITVGAVRYITAGFKWFVGAFGIFINAIVNLTIKGTRSGVATLKTFTTWSRPRAVRLTRQFGTGLASLLRRFATSTATVGEASRRLTTNISRKVVSQPQTIAYAALTLALFTGAVSAISMGVFSQLPKHDVITGKAQIIDADLIKVGETDIRLFGIDAPEPTQRCKRRSRGRANWGCGRKAVSQLSRLISNNKVRCIRKSTDNLGRLIAQCSMREFDIGAYMVGKGLAWISPGDPAGYEQFQRAAKLANLGIWRAESDTPWHYREARWQLAKARAPAGCPVKGNISGAGRVYYLPWSNQYDRVQIQPKKGERWFCNEREAIQAGWRLTRYP